MSYTPIFLYRAFVPFCGLVYDDTFDFDTV